MEATADGPVNNSPIPQEHLQAWSAYCFQTLYAKLSKTNLPAYPSKLPDPKYALFVTWTTGADEDLRGCIGTFSQDNKLSKVLGRYALVSSLEDDRFPPVKLQEVPNLNVGLSLLVNFKSINDPLDWKVGQHGIEIDFTVKGRDYSSTFLPEVAEEQGWD